MDIKALCVTVIFLAALSGCASSGSAGNSEAAAASVAATESAAAEATVAATESAPAAETDPNDPDAVRCKRIAKAGTRLKTKVCATNREWAASEARAQDTIFEMQREGAVGRE